MVSVSSTNRTLTLERCGRACARSPLVRRTSGRRSRPRPGWSARRREFLAACRSGLLPRLSAHDLGGFGLAAPQVAARTRARSYRVVQNRSVLQRHWALAISASITCRAPRVSSTAAVTGGSQKSRLWASSQMGSEAENPRNAEPGTRCRHTAEARWSGSSRRCASGGPAAADEGVRNGCTPSLRSPRRCGGSPWSTPPWSALPPRILQRGPRTHPRASAPASPAGR